jgi:hypothetical protein
MNSLLVPGLVILGIVVISVLFSWICYKNFTSDN